MQNYLDPVANTWAVQVAELGWETLQLAVDWAYSMFKFALYFIQENFALIAVLWVLIVVGWLGLKKLFSKARAKTKVI